MASTLVMGVDIAVAALTFAYIGKLLFQNYVVKNFDAVSQSYYLCEFESGKASLGHQSVSRKIRL